jgi:hypothetical protein
MRKNAGKTAASLLISALCLALSVGSAFAATLYQADFDNTSPGTLELSGGSISTVDNPAKDAVNVSNKAGRCRVDNGGKRAEYSGPRLPTNEKKYVYRWMYYLPADFYTANLGWIVLSQWKTWPCEVCTNYGTEICYGCGGIFDEVRADERAGYYTFRWRAMPDCNSHDDPVTLGVWVSFVMDIYWTNTASGYVKLWKNGTLIKEIYNFKTLFDRFPADGSCNIYWAVGLYGPLTGAKAYADVYIDNISIEDEPATGVLAPAPSLETPQVFWITAQGSRTQLKLDGVSRVTGLAIRDIHGRIVRHLGVPSSTSCTIVWDGRDDHEKTAAAGVYVVTVPGARSTAAAKLVLLK